VRSRGDASPGSPRARHFVPARGVRSPGVSAAHPRSARESEAWGASSGGLGGVAPPCRAEGASNSARAFSRGARTGTLFAMAENLGRRKLLTAAVGVATLVLTRCGPEPETPPGNLVAPPPPPPGNLVAPPPPHPPGNLMPVDPPPQPPPTAPNEGGPQLPQDPPPQPPPPPPPGNLMPPPPPPPGNLVPPPPPPESQ
jgi:hypothetical protein